MSSCPRICSLLTASTEDGFHIWDQVVIDRRRCRGSGTVSVIGDFMYKIMHEGPYANNMWLIDAFVFFTYGRVSDTKLLYKLF